MQKHGNRNYHLTQGFESLTVLQKSAATIFPKRINLSSFQHLLDRHEKVNKVC